MNDNRSAFFASYQLWFSLMAWLGLSSIGQASQADDQPQAVPAVASTIEGEMTEGELVENRGHIVWVPFPLQEIDDRRIRLRIQQIIDRHPGPGRPVVVLQFVAKSGTPRVEDQPAAKTLGRGTEFERSLSLARWLVGPVGVRARTIAYLPDSIESHAVLVALASEEIAMAPLAEIGRITIDDPTLDQVVVDGYLGIAERRGAFPAEAVRSMIDREALLYKVEMADEQSRFVSLTELESLRQTGRVLSETQLSIPGQLGSFTGQEMRSWRWITHLTRDEVQLRESLAIKGWEVQKKLAIEGPVKPALIEIRGVVSPSSVNRWMRTIDEARSQDHANILILHIHSPGGDLAESLRLAEYLANMDDMLSETIAWVDEEARGDAALIGLACDSLLLKSAAILGGPGEATIDAASVRSLNQTWQSLSQATHRTEGELYGFLCPDLDLHEFLHPSGRIEIGDSELFAQRADAKDWTAGRVLAFSNGVSAEEAVQRHWAEAVLPNLTAVAEQWGIEKLPEPNRVSPLEQWIRSLADQEWLATLLLTLALVFFTNELTTPGLGLAGFMSLLCVSLFFWMKFLDGTVEWLEITLCIVGILALALEIFVLPGFGIFGFGGFVMLVAGIVLASQTFIVPSNDYQWGKLAVSTGQIAIACIGLMTTIYLLRNQLERMPFVRMLKLQPPPADMAIEVPEDWNHLIGCVGVTTSRCAPRGKALIRDQYWDVLSPEDLLETDTDVVVVDVQDRSIFVRRVSSNESVS